MVVRITAPWHRFCPHCMLSTPSLPTLHSFSLQMRGFDKWAEKEGMGTEGRENWREGRAVGLGLVAFPWSKKLIVALLCSWQFVRLKITTNACEKQQKKQEIWTDGGFLWFILHYERCTFSPFFYTFIAQHFTFLQISVKVVNTVKQCIYKKKEFTDFGP